MGLPLQATPFSDINYCDMKHKFHLLFLAMVISCSPAAFSSQATGYPLLVSYRDSVIASDSSPFIYNMLVISNKSVVKSELRIVITPPEGWRALSDTIPRLHLLPNDSLLVPVTILRLPTAAAQWQKCRISITSGNHSVDYFFHIRSVAVAAFSAKAGKETIFVEKKQTLFAIPVYIRNTGSTSGHYTISFRGEKLNLRKPAILNLPPGKDSLIQATFPLPFNFTGTQKLMVQVEESSGLFRSFPVEVSRLSNELKVHPAAYARFITEFETGLIGLDKEMSYFGALNLQFPVGRSVISAGYRSRMFGALNSLERDVITLGLTSTHWNINAGHMTNTKDIYAYGNGATIEYRSKNGTVLNARGILHADTMLFPTDYAGLTLSYHANKMFFSHNIDYGFDHRQSLAGILFSSKWHPIKSNAVDLKITAAIGEELYVASTAKKQQEPGYGGGYQFSWNAARWSFYSAVQYHTLQYPGINKGLESQDHSLRWQKGKFFAGAFFQRNITVSQVLKDTIYQSDQFTYNMTRYGVRYGLGNGKYYTSLNLGLFQQSGYFTQSVPSYYFGEYAYSVVGKRIRCSFNSINGYTRYQDSLQIYFTNTSLDFSAGVFGMKAFYVQSPLFTHGTKALRGYEKTLVAGPYLRFTLFKKLSLNLRYTVSRSLQDDRLASAVAMNAVFSDMRRNTFFSFSGAMPLKASAAPMQMGLSSAYFSVSLKKGFHLPIPFKRKYHDLRVKAFLDANNNGALDAGEQPISNLRIQLNNSMMVTDATGIANLLHADTGLYRVQILDHGSLKGVEPQAGYTSYTRLTRSSVLLVPFSTSKVIYGYVSIQKDSLSQTNFVLSNIRITVTSLATGKVYTTLTADNGEYFLNLPAGRYRVSLNPLAISPDLVPVQLEYEVNMEAVTSKEINFLLREKRRQVHLLVQ